MESVALLAEWERQTFGVRSRFAREIKQTSATRPLPLALHVSGRVRRILRPAWHRAPESARHRRLPQWTHWYRSTYRWWYRFRFR